MCHIDVIANCWSEIHVEIDTEIKMYRNTDLLVYICLKYINKYICKYACKN